MLIKGLDCTVSIVCVLYFIGCWAGCIALLFYLYLTIVMLYGHLHQFSFLNAFILNFIHWFLSCKDFPSAPWLNIDVFMLLLLFTELFIGFHHCSYLADTFRYPTAVTSQTGRNNHSLFVPRVRTSYGKNRFYYIYIREHKFGTL